MLFLEYCTEIYTSKKKKKQLHVNEPDLRFTFAGWRQILQGRFECSTISRKKSTSSVIPGIKFNFLQICTLHRNNIFPFSVCKHMLFTLQLYYANKNHSNSYCTELFLQLLEVNVPGHMTSSNQGLLILR